MKIEPERIQKWLAARGYGSRREIERWIIEGRLRINGKIAELGMKITGHERLSLDGKPLRADPEKDSPLQILMYHKPIGEICTVKDPEGRRTVFQSLPKLRQGRWISIGRLDINTAGLLLFTNDGNLANRLMHPRAQIEREYWVRVAGNVTEEVLDALRKGVELEDGIARFKEIYPLKTINEDDNQHNKYFSVILTEGKNREVRRLWETVGCQVSRLKRIRFGNAIMPKHLSSGKYRFLEEFEIKALQQLAYKK